MKEYASSAPAQLVERASSIAGGASRHGGVKVSLERWERWLGEGKGFAGWTSKEVESALAPLRGESITRQQLKVLARDSDGRKGLRQLLVVTLAWGMGKANARMMPGIVRLVNHERLESALRVAAARASSDDPAGAHRAWVKHRLPGIGEPFFTKWLWVASYITAARDESLPRDVRLHCLTLDGRVWSSLRELGWDGRAAAKSRLRSDRYAAYVDACHTWAKHLKEKTGSPVSAEDVEWALFHAAGDLSRLR